MSFSSTGYGDREFGFLIRGNDLDTFMGNYIRMNPAEFEKCSSEEEALDKMRDLLQINEEFTGSSEGHSFNAMLFGSAADNVDFFPTEKDRDGFSCDPDLTVMISPDMPMTSRRILSGTFYRSLEEAETEFKEKAGKYLPADFDFKANIGDFAYSLYF